MFLRFLDGDPILLAHGPILGHVPFGEMRYNSGPWCSQSRSLQLIDRF